MKFVELNAMEKYVSFEMTEDEYNKLDEIRNRAKRKTSLVVCSENEEDTNRDIIFDQYVADALIGSTIYLYDKKVVLLHCYIGSRMWFKDESVLVTYCFNEYKKFDTFTDMYCFMMRA